MNVTILNGDVRDVLLTLPAESVQCCVTPPADLCVRPCGVYLTSEIAIPSRVRSFDRSRFVAFVGQSRPGCDDQACNGGELPLSPGSIQLPAVSGSGGEPSLQLAGWQHSLLRSFDIWVIAFHQVLDRSVLWSRATLKWSLVVQVWQSKKRAGTQSEWLRLFSGVLFDIPNCPLRQPDQRDRRFSFDRGLS